MPDLFVPGPARRHELDLALAALHFAFRAVTEGPDAALAEQGLSRAHHRILYFVRKTPDLRVSQLRATLGVTKQAMHAPLRELVERGLVAEAADEVDRRRKCLRLTAQGRDLEERLSGPQRDLFERVFAKVGHDTEKAWREVMHLLANTAPRGTRRR